MYIGSRKFWERPFRERVFGRSPASAFVLGSFIPHRLCGIFLQFSWIIDQPIGAHRIRAMAIKDSGSIFERVYNGMESLCGDGSLSHRLESVIQIIAPLRADDFPELMRHEFAVLKEDIAAMRSAEAKDEHRNRLV